MKLKHGRRKYEFMSLQEFRFSFAGMLRSARYEHHHTQIELSQLIGIRRATISDWENAKSLPDLYIFSILENLYGRAYFSRSSEK